MGLAALSLPAFSVGMEFREIAHKALDEWIDTFMLRVALLADGAASIWNALQECFPEGRQILDYYHCAEHVREVADGLYSQGSLEAREWAEAVLTELCLGNVNETKISRPHRLTPKPFGKPSKSLSVTSKTMLSASIISTTWIRAFTSAAVPWNQPTNTSHTPE
jgi:transposase